MADFLLPVDDWRNNPPTYWVLERAGHGECNPQIVFTTMIEKEAFKERDRLTDEKPNSVFIVETRTEM